MPAPNKTVLDITQDIIQMLDSEDINSISDTPEAQQIVAIMENVFYGMATNRDIPEHHSLIKLDAASDNTQPTVFYVPENVRKIDCIWYAKDNTSFEYRTLSFITKELFLARSDAVQSNYDNIKELDSGINLRIRNDTNPLYWTSFNDGTIYMDSYDNTLDSSLQESKVRSMGWTIPVFKRQDDWVVDVDPPFITYLTYETAAQCWEMFKGGPSQKLELVARRAYSNLLNDFYKMGNDTHRINRWPNYGRRYNY